MVVTDDLLARIADGAVEDVRIGTAWTAVVARVDGQRRCGLAATERWTHVYGRPMVRDAGRLTACSARDLAVLARSDSPTEVSVGFAAINALLPQTPDCWTDLNAAELIARHGEGKRVALVGHFPFVDELRPQVGTLWVLEMEPQAGDLPASAAAGIVPQADVLAMTGTTLLNGTFDGLMALRRPDALAMLLGPTTPLSPVLFDHGLNLLSGSVVTDIDAVLRSASQGANFRQLHKAGVRLVTMQATSKSA